MTFCHLDGARTRVLTGLRFVLVALAALALGAPVRAKAPTDGPGGPILLVTSNANPFSTYYAEILRAEGLNAFTVADLGTVTPATLSGYDVVLLGDMPLQAAQVAMLDAWVRAGGNLIAMRPDKQLYGLLGLTDATGTLSEKYIGVNTAVAPGAGITGAALQFHGTADLATPNGVATVATLYSDAMTATTHPAVTLRLVGIQGGQAAAFLFDLARSVVLTRQGNPLWSGQDRDGASPIRSTDLFIGAAPGDAQPDWNDMTRSHIPHADELQRLLANLVLHVNRDRKPLPRFWYLPRGAKAAVVMTGDEHGSGNFVSRFSDLYNSAVNSPSGCSVEDWECTRATAYIYPITAVTDQTIVQLTQQGFEIALHPTTTGVPGACSDFSPASLDAAFTAQLQDIAVNYPGMPAPRTSRTHCVVWSDYSSQAEVELQHGIRLDTTYYAWPAEFIRNRPGFFTGAAMPMRFATATGEMLDVYQVPTQMTDESGQSQPETIQTLIDRALGPDGYFGVFAANMHTDGAVGSMALASGIVAVARSRQVPVVSAEQMLDWLDGRNQSTFGSIAWNGTSLSFTVDQAPGARGLQALLPHSAGGALQSIARDGNPVAFSVETIKGITYARFQADTGAYVATYQGDSAAPVIANRLATVIDSSKVAVTWATSEPATTVVVYGTDAGALDREITDGALLASHTIVIQYMNASTTYYYRVASADIAGNVAVSPPLTDPPAAIVMPPPTTVFTDTAEEQFAEGHPGAGTQLTRTIEGEVTLAPLDGSEFFGGALPSAWSTEVWAGGGATLVEGGELHLSNGLARGGLLHTAGRTLTFKAAFAADAFQHAGLGLNFGSEEPWAIFSTGDSPGQLRARTSAGGESLVETLIPGDWISAPHVFRIDWSADRVEYFIDDSPAAVASHAVSIGSGLRVAASDFDLAPNTGVLAIDWMRLSPYAAGGSFDSRVFDAGATVEWETLLWTIAAPPGTAAVFAVRTGNTAVPDATWSAFTPVAASGGAIGRQSRFAQYRATLSTSDPEQTPEILEVTLTNGGALASAALSPASWNAEASGETTTALLTINPSSQAWAATSDQSWLTVSPSSGVGSATLTLTVTANPTAGPRAAAITVAGLTLAVTQAATPLALTSLTLSQSSVAACTVLTATVTLNVPAPEGGAVVAVHTTHTSAIVPGTVIVAAGQTQRSFSIDTVPADAPVTDVITATAWNGSLGAPLTVQAGRVRSFSFSDDSVVGGGTVVATAGLPCAAGAGGVTVEWSSADPALAQPLAAVTRIEAGAQTTSVTVATSGVTKKDGTFIRAASAGGEVKKRLVVTP